MVTRTGDNRIELSEVHRWAEDLAAGFTRVLREDLGNSSSWGRVIAYPWNSLRGPDYSVELDLVRFERTAVGAVDLWAYWRVWDVAAGRVVGRGEARVSEPATGPQIAQSVAAQSRAIARLAREITATLENVR